MFPVEAEKVDPKEYKSARDFAKRMARVALINKMALLDRTVNRPYTTRRYQGLVFPGPKQFSLEDPARLAEYLSPELGQIVNGGNQKVEVEVDPNGLIVINPNNNHALLLNPNIEPWHHPFVNAVWLGYDRRASLLKTEYNEALVEGKYDFDLVFHDADALISLVCEQTQQQGLAHPVRDIPLLWTDLLI